MIIALLIYITIGLVVMEILMPKFDFWDMVSWALLWPLIIVLGIIYIWRGIEHESN